MKKQYISFVILSLLLIIGCKHGKNQDGHDQNHDDKTHVEDSHNESAEIEITEEQMKMIGTQLGKIEQRNLNNIIKVNGKLALSPQKKAEVTSLMGGIIKKFTVSEASTITAGQTVAYLENTEIVELQKNYLTLKNQALMAEQEYQRQKNLSEQGAGIGKVLQQAHADYEITKARLIGLEKQLMQLSISPQQVSLGNIVTQIPIKSPISGIIGKINASTGSYVDMQTPLMNIYDISDIHCDVKVFEKDINTIKVGQEVDITLTNQPGTKLKGEVNEISSFFEDETKSINVHIDIKDKKDKNLIPDIYVTALINVGVDKKDAVPNDAIVSNEGKKYIFVLEKERLENNEKTYHFEKVEVLTGISDMGYTEITPVEKLDRDATIVKSNAFYLGSMSGEHGEHNH